MFEVGGSETHVQILKRRQKSTMKKRMALILPTNASHRMSVMIEQTLGPVLRPCQLERLSFPRYKPSVDNISRKIRHKERGQVAVEHHFPA